MNMISDISNKIIDIVIPVYKDYAITKTCIESVLNSKITFPHELVVINDCSPEPEVARYLEQLATEHKITLLQNTENKGFVHSVNRGMKLHLDRDILLLNSDTCVANNWLDRLRNCAYADPNIATVTPFSNNATICSYPKFCKSNELPSDYDLEALDQLFAETNNNAFVQIPTAVGFCMYIKRDALNAVGFFDEERFGKGYGEENDFCLRAEKNGWKHVIACDVFVYHEGSVSFGDSKNERIEQAGKIINSLYPNYRANVQKFILNDELRFYRIKIDIKRLAASKKLNYLHCMHNGKGGILKHIEDLAKYLGDQINVLLIKQVRKGIQLIWCNDGEILNLYFRLSQLDQFIAFLKFIKIHRVHIHHIKNWNDNLTKIITRLNVLYDYTIHDYYTFCPQISVTTKAGKYCELPDASACQNCLKGRFKTRNIDIIKWRQINQNLLEKAARVFVPSASVMDIMQVYFKNVNFVLASHPELNLVQKYQPMTKVIKANEKIKILVLGGLSKIKGADVLVRCATIAKQNNQPIEFHLLGYPYRFVKSNSHLIIHGAYADQDVQQLIQKIAPHFAWFPSQWPETFSYTLSSCFQAQLPVIATDLGAQAERIKNCGQGIIKSWKTTAEEWNELFLKLKDGTIGLSTVEKAAVQDCVENFNYPHDYVLSTIEQKETLESKEFWDNYQIFIQKALKKINTDLKSALKHKIFLCLYKSYHILSTMKLIPRKNLERYKILMKRSLIKDSD